VTSGCSGPIANSTLAVPVEREMPPPWMRPSAVPPAIAAWISASRGDVLPCSAMASIPGEAVPRGSQKTTRAECVAPMSGEKWALPGKSAGWVAALQVASKVTR